MKGKALCGGINRVKYTTEDTSNAFSQNIPLCLERVHDSAENHRCRAAILRECKSLFHPVGVGRTVRMCSNSKNNGFIGKGFSKLVDINKLACDRGSELVCTGREVLCDGILDNLEENF